MVFANDIYVQVLLLSFLNDRYIFISALALKKVAHILWLSFTLNNLFGSQEEILQALYYSLSKIGSVILHSINVDQETSDKPGSNSGKQIHKKNLKHALKLYKWCIWLIQK